jgi:hypothetical protein
MLDGSGGGAVGWRPRMATAKVAAVGGASSGVVAAAGLASGLGIGTAAADNPADNVASEISVTPPPSPPPVGSGTPDEVVIPGATSPARARRSGTGGSLRPQASQVAAAAWFCALQNGQKRIASGLRRRPRAPGAHAVGRRSLIPTARYSSESSRSGPYPKSIPSRSRGAGRRPRARRGRDGGLW